MNSFAAMSYYTTEITSDEIASDGPLHHRLLFPYEQAATMVSGQVLEIGCGFGRGVELLRSAAEKYTGIDKIEGLVKELSEKFPDSDFKAMNIPPLHDIPDNTFDWVISFQVIEHIKKDLLYLQEIKRVLKPGGKAIITTPNKKYTLSRNPWHIREYHVPDLKELCGKVFDNVDAKGVAGNEKVMDYHEQNRKSVKKAMWFDPLGLQWVLPAWMLKKPYEMMNRKNRKKLMDQDRSLVSSIQTSDYYLNEDPNTSLDHFYILTK